EEEKGMDGAARHAAGCGVAARRRLVHAGGNGCPRLPLSSLTINALRGVRWRGGRSQTERSNSRIIVRAFPLCQGTAWPYGAAPLRPCLRVARSLSVAECNGLALPSKELDCLDDRD